MARIFVSPSLDTNPHRYPRSSLGSSPHATASFPPATNSLIYPVAPRVTPSLLPQINSLLYSNSEPGNGFDANRFLGGSPVRAFHSAQIAKRLNAMSYACGERKSHCLERGLIFRPPLTDFPDMFLFVSILLRALASGFRSRRCLVLENLALRHQLMLLKRSVPRPNFNRADRLFWVLLQHCWADWQRVLAIVQPRTVLAWHRLGFRLFWRWKSRPGVGRPSLEPELVHADPPDVVDQSHLGQQTNSSRTGQTGPQRVGFHRPQVPPRNAQSWR